MPHRWLQPHLRNSPRRKEESKQLPPAPFNLTLETDLEMLGCNRILSPQALSSVHTREAPGGPEECARAGNEG